MNIEAMLHLVLRELHDEKSPHTPGQKVHFAIGALTEILMILHELKQELSNEAIPGK